MHERLETVDMLNARGMSALSERSLFSARRGQSLVEYALIILLVAIAVVAALALLAPTINSIFRAIPPVL